MYQHPLPRKNIFSYLLPFLFIILLIGTAIYILKYNLNLDELKKIFQPPPVAKEDKVRIVFQAGGNQYKPWRESNWLDFQTDTFFQAGDSIRTATGGQLVLRFFENSELRVKGNTTIKLIRLDKDDSSGNHIEVELISGQVWRRGPDGNTLDADFIINTSNQVILINKAAVVDISTNPEITRVLGGSIEVNVAEKAGDSRKPITRLELAAGDELLLDELAIDELKAGKKDLLTVIDDKYLQSEWYLWNMDKEEKLGLIVEMFAVGALKPENLEKLPEGMVVVSSPLPDTSTGPKVLIQGTFDSEKIAKILANGDEAILGAGNDWEYAATLTEQKNSLLITAFEKDQDKEKLVISYKVNVDATGPALGNISQPTIDANGNGEISGDSLELVGEVSNDASRVCVAHNDGDPYCLKKYSAGETVYRYLGSVGYGNVSKGKNKYSISAFDKFENSSTKTIYLFKDEAKPGTKIEETTTVTVEGNDSFSSLNKPVITDPNPANQIISQEKTIVIKGTIDSRAKSLLVNGKKAVYEAGSGSFEISFELSEGENQIKFQAVDAQGEKSKTNILTVIYVPKEEDNTDL